jgi:hypothetical protein
VCYVPGRLTLLCAALHFALVHPLEAAEIRTWKQRSLWLLSLLQPLGLTLVEDGALLQHVVIRRLVAELGWESLSPRIGFLPFPLSLCLRCRPTLGVPVLLLLHPLHLHSHELFLQGVLLELTLLLLLVVTRLVPAV